MKLDYRHLALVLVAATSLPACKGMWNDFFGSGSASQKALGIEPGGTEVCNPERDPDIASKLANNVPCSADSQCPVGSFCTGNGVSGTCIRECGDGLPACTGQRYCSCKGVCEDVPSGGVDGGTSPTPLTCERDDALLEQIKGNRTCQVAADCLNESPCDVASGLCRTRQCTWDVDCPNGSSCDTTIARCNWSCKADTDCADGQRCDCYGKCISAVGVDGGVSMLRKAFNLVASPTTVDILPALTGGAAWVRAVHVSLQTRDSSMLVSSHGGMNLGPDIDQKLTVRPGANLLVACDNNSEQNFSTQCTFDGTWYFSAEGDVWKADRVLYIKQAQTLLDPDAGLGDAWTVRLASTITTPSVRDVTVNIQPGDGNVAWTPDPTFTSSDYRGYFGTVHLETPLGKGGSTVGGIQPGVDLSVKARLHECTQWVRGGDTPVPWVCLTFSDPATLITDKETLTVYLHSQDGATRGTDTFAMRPFWEFGCATNTMGLTGLARTSVRLASSRRSEPAGRLSGVFKLTKGTENSDSQNPGWLDIEASFDLAPDDTAACTEDSNCKGGTTCDPSGLCVRKKPLSGCDYSATGTQQGASNPAQIVFHGSDIGDAIRAEMKTAPNHLGFYYEPALWKDLYYLSYDPDAGIMFERSPFRYGPSATTGNPYVIAPELIKGEMAYSTVSLQLATAMSAWADSLFLQTWVSQLTYYHGSATIANWQWRDEIQNLLNSSSSRALVPCMDGDNPNILQGSSPHGIKTLPDWAADCGRFWENVRAVATRSEDFRDDCQGTDLLLEVAEPNGTVAQYQTYLCPEMAKVLGLAGSATGSPLVESASRYLCQDGQQSSTATGLETAGIEADASLLGYSGELPCHNRYFGSGDYRPSGIDLLTLQDSSDQTATQVNYGTLMRTCIGDLQAGMTIPSLSIDAGDTAQEIHDTRKQWLASVFGRRTCFSPAHFWTAFATTRDAWSSVPRDQAGERFHFGLIKQWLQLHAFILTQGLEEYRLAKTEEGNKTITTNAVTGATDPTAAETPKAVPLATIMDLAETALGLAVARAGGGANAVEAMQGALQYPDWRPDMNNQKQAGDEQAVGLPVVLVETATKYLRVVEAYLEEISLGSYAEVVDGLLPEELVVAQRRAGNALRLTSLIEEIASGMNRIARGEIQVCRQNRDVEDCGEYACSLDWDPVSNQPGPTGICANRTASIPPWADQYAAATTEYARVQRDVAKLAQSEMNPLGIDETDLPLFFGDLTGTNSRFFAASDYLLNTWAISAVQTAQAALDKARDAWVQRRNATLQDEMNAAEEDRRIEGIKTKYGEIIASNCGLSAKDNPIATVDVLEKARDFFDPNGPKERCYMASNLKNEAGQDICVEVAPSVDESAYGQCVAAKKLEAMSTNLEQMGFFKRGIPDPQVYVSGSLVTVTWACRNYFHLNPTDTSENVPVYVRIGSGPISGTQMRQGAADFTWFQPEEQKSGDGLVLNGCDLMSPGSYATITAGKSAAGDNEKNELAVLRCRKNQDGVVVCDRPDPTELQNSTADENCLCVKPRHGSDVQGMLMGTEFDRWWNDNCIYPKVCDQNMNDVHWVWSQMKNTAIGGITKYFGCKSALFAQCGPEQVQWKPAPATCNNTNNPGTKLLVDTGDGADYRDCGQAQGQSRNSSGGDWAWGPDSCGWRIPFGYGNPLWWNDSNDHTGENYFVEDAYREEACSYQAYWSAVQEQMKLLPLPVSLTQAIDQSCQNQQGVPTDMGGKLTALPMPAECYLGQLGATVIKGYGALEDVQLAKLAWGAAQESYDIQGQICAQVKQEQEDTEARQSAFASQMSGWRTAKLVADSLAAVAGAAASAMTTWGMSEVAAGFQIAGMTLQTKMENAQMQFDNFMRSQALAEKVFQCFAEANKLQAQFEVQKGQILRRTTDLAAAQQEFSRLYNETERAYSEGIAALARETARGNNAPTFAFHYWYEEKAERYLREFKWAKRLVYLAMRAVEYEFQQTLGLRKQILTAQHPDQLEGAVQAMQAEVATRAINRRRPQELSVVLSLRDDILGIIDASRFQEAGERKATPVRAFQDRLWDSKYSIFDKDGRWAGQGIPFTVTPQGSLLDRCAERLWRVTATVQGDGLSSSQPGASLRLLKRNTFSSQWCEGKGGGEKMQVGQLEPSKNLFRDDPGPGISGENNAYSTAAIYPWFNVRRSDFYKTAYQDGASEELAGRGLYGEYILLFPSQLLEGKEVPNPPPGELVGHARIDEFPLNRVEDVLIRFDYLSVDNFAARGVQPNP